MESFALENIYEGIIFINNAKEEIQITFANKQASSFFGWKTNSQEWFDTITSKNEFFQTIKNCMQKKKSDKEVFAIKIDNRIENITFHFLPYDENFIVLLLEKDKKKFEFFGLPKESTSAIVEYYPELKDWKYLTVSSSHKQNASLIGKYAVRDCGVPKKLLEFFDANQSMLNVKFQTVELEYTTPSDLKKLRMDIALVNHSEAGRPILSVHFLDEVILCNKAEISPEISGVDEFMQLSKLIFEHPDIAVGTSEISEDGQNIQVKLLNKTGRKLFGFDENEDISKANIPEFIPQHIIEFWVQKSQECAKAGRPIIFECAFPSLGKTFSQSLIQASERRFSHLSVDITAKQLHDDEVDRKVKKRTSELEGALLAKGRFLATMSHELRTPISGISGSLQLLSETALSSEQFEIVNIANVCTQQLLTVINDILDLSKLEANKMHIEEIQCDSRQVVEESIEVVSFLAEKKRIEIICDIDASVPKIFLGDSVRLKQVLINLLTNAIKFSHEGNIIVNATASTKEDGKMEFLFSVKDEGIGISDEVKSNLFHPFTQAETSTSRKYGGSGLGLSICKRLCEIMGGKIWFESKLKEGSTFYFTISVSCPQQPTLENLPFLHGKRIHVIEENEAIIDILRNMCSKHNMKFSSENSLLTLESCDADILLIDCNTKGLNPKILMNLSNQCHVSLLGFSDQLKQWEEYRGIHTVKKPIRFKNFFASLCQEKTSPPQASRPLPCDAVILVAEDNRLNQEIIRKTLLHLGFTKLDFVENGKLAVEAALSKSFDIVLMDVMMPEMGGIEATSIIRQNKEIKQPTIIALTADALLENEGKLTSCGFDDIVIKPIDKTKFGNLLRKYIYSAS